MARIELFTPETDIPAESVFNAQRILGGQYRNRKIQKADLLGADVVRFEETILLSALAPSVQIQFPQAILAAGYTYAILPWSHARYNAPNAGPYAGQQEFRITTGGSAGAIYTVFMDMQGTDVTAPMRPRVGEYRVDDSLDVGVFSQNAFTPVSGSVTFVVWVARIAL